MAKVLSEHEKSMRKDNPNYFKNGKPKKKAMLCKNRNYISLMVYVYGHYDSNWMCSTNDKCPLWATGCDHQGKDWL